MQKLKRKYTGTTILIISNEEMKNIMKIVQALEDSKESLKQLKTKQKNKKEDS